MKEKPLVRNPAAFAGGINLFPRERRLAIPGERMAIQMYQMREIYPKRAPEKSRGMGVPARAGRNPL